MTEVRNISTSSSSTTTEQQKGLFATQEYKQGDVILNEVTPLFVFASSSSSCTDDNNNDDENEDENNKLMKSQFQSCIFENETNDKQQQHDASSTSSSSSFKNKKKKKERKKEGKKEAVNLLENITLPSSSFYSSSSSSNYIGKYRGMILAVCSYAVAFYSNKTTTTTKEEEEEMEKKKKEILSLYYPNFTLSNNNNNNNNNDDKQDKPKEEEEEDAIIIQIAKTALQYCQTNSKPNSPLATLVTNNNNTSSSSSSSPTEEEEAIQVMLIWSCNAFDGGLLYKQCSRINHSCNPNAIVVVTNNNNNNNNLQQHQQQQCQQQIIKAVDTILPGEQITISYIGIFTYSDVLTRKRRLFDTKHFNCNCQRCTSTEEEEDVAGFIPCPQCHEREMGGRYLEEDVQYDDDNEVCYAYPFLCNDEKKEEEEENNNNNKNKNEIYSYNLDKVKCKSCKETTKGGVVLKLSQKCIEKVTAHLLSSSFSTTSNNNNNNNNNNNKKKEKNSTIHAELTENLHQMSLSVLGSKHWCTNLLLFSILEHTITSLHSAILLNSTISISSSSSSSSGRKKKDEEEKGLDMTEIAQAIDSLQRLWSFTSSLKLKKLHGAHLLHDVTLGVSRVLVSLGDVKSQKYGVEWVERVEEYVRLILQDDDDVRVKVVEAIKNSWKRGNEEEEKKKKKNGGEEKGQNPRKRLKTG